MPKPKTPAERRREQRRRARERREERERQERRQERNRRRRQRERRQERRDLRDEKLLTPEQRRRRIRKVRDNKDLTKEQERRRIKKLRETADTAAAKRVARWSDLSPIERRRISRRIRQSDRLSQAQERWRLAQLRASGPVARKGRLDVPSNVPPLEPDQAESFEDLLTGEKRNAFRLIMLEFARIGLGKDLAKEVYDAVVNGITNVEMILDIVRLSDAYKKRFPGMALRDPSAPPLSEAEYIDIEERYRWIMAEAGLPQGFYDKPGDFAKFIGNDVGPLEFQGRVDAAKRVSQRVDPRQRELLARFYGIGEGELTAYFLDQKVALPILQRHVEASGVAVYAQQAGVDHGRGIRAFANLVDLGVTEDEARSSYGAISQIHKDLSKFDNIYGENYGVRDAERDVFLGDGDERRRLVRKEQATWSGSSRGATGRGDRSLSY